MKKAVYYMIILLTILNISSNVYANQSEIMLSEERRVSEQYSEDEILILVKDGYISRKEILALPEEEQNGLNWLLELSSDLYPHDLTYYCNGIKQMNFINDSPCVTMQLKDGVTVVEAIKGLSECAAFQCVEPNYILYPSQEAPDDSEIYADDRVLILIDGKYASREEIEILPIEQQNDLEWIYNLMSDEEVAAFDECCSKIMMVTYISSAPCVLVGLNGSYDVEETIKMLEGIEAFQIIEPDYKFKCEAVPNDPLVGNDYWAYDCTNLYRAWDYVHSDYEVDVAVLDTGFFSAHEDLSGQVISSMDVTQMYGTNVDIDNEVFHGTAVCGIVSAKANNAKGANGTSYNANLISINVHTIDNNGDIYTYDSYIIAALTSAIDLGVDVVNMSFGHFEAFPYLGWQQLRLKCIECAENDIVLICSAGNEPIDTPCYPACFPECIAVISMADSTTTASYSALASADRRNEISAPGERIIAPGGGYNTYRMFNGTSAAAPFVTGVAALMRAASPQLSAAQVKEILFASATDLGASGWDVTFGNGLINAERAVIMAGEYYSSGIRAFVSRLFINGLGRNPDFIEERLYGALLEEGKTACSVAKSIFFSGEFENRGLSDADYVQTLYQTLLGRNGTSSDVNHYVQFLRVGMSRKYVFYQFINSAEFANICSSAGIIKGTGYSDENRDQSFQVTSFVYRLYDKCLDRNPDISGLNSWTGVLLNHIAGGSSVAHGFFFSQEFINKNTTNTVYVTLLYQTLMNRTPSNSEVALWVNSLANGATREQVFNGFAGSAEFANICNSYGIDP